MVDWSDGWMDEEGKVKGATLLWPVMALRSRESIGRALFQALGVASFGSGLIFLKHINCFRGITVFDEYIFPLGINANPEVCRVILANGNNYTIFSLM